MGKNLRRAEGMAYLDAAARTPLDPRVAAAVRAAECDVANPHSPWHELGARARGAVEQARAQVAESIGAKPTQVVLTSGATEANNLAVLGCAAAFPSPRHVVTCATEHASVLEPLRHLEARGWRVTRLPVDGRGRVSPEQVERALARDTVLIALMLVNNELGTVHDVAAVAEIARTRAVRFHCDAAQALGRVDVDARGFGVTTLAISGHKVHGPAGIGALYVEEPSRLSPICFGGGQEFGLRPGTVPTALAAGLGLACSLAQRELAATAQRNVALCSRLREWLALIPDTSVLSPEDAAATGILSVLFRGVQADDLLTMVGDRLAASAGAACSALVDATSHVIAQLNLPGADRRSVVRLSVSRLTEDWEIEIAMELLSAAVGWLRQARGVPALRSSRGFKMEAVHEC